MRSDNQFDRAVIEQLRAENARMREALEKYANPSNWHRRQTGIMYQQVWAGEQDDPTEPARTALSAQSDHVADARKMVSPAPSLTPEEAKKILEEHFAAVTPDELAEINARVNPPALTPEDVREQAAGIAELSVAGYPQGARGVVAKERIALANDIAAAIRSMPLAATKAKSAPFKVGDRVRTLDEHQLATVMEVGEGECLIHFDVHSIYRDARVRFDLLTRTSAKPPAANASEKPATVTPLPKMCRCGHDFNAHYSHPCEETQWPCCECECVNFEEKPASEKETK